MSVKFAGVFSGIGGFELAFTRKGYDLRWHCEAHKPTRAFLENKFPGAKSYADIRGIETAENVGLICGGDPCPIRSRARAGRQSKSPDLAGYFLALIARLSPQWVVRENVPAPDVNDFATALELLGYGVTVVELDARDFTGQSRRRQFCIGSPRNLAAKIRQAILNAADAYGFVPSRSWEETPITACLTAHHMRMAAEDTYCFEPERGLRVLTSEECELLQGFPRGWTSGLSTNQRRIRLGNAVNVKCVEWIADRILETVA
jgi:DNA (cytosine-5)-methyltransferase 1